MSDQTLASVFEGSLHRTRGRALCKRCNAEPIAASVAVQIRDDARHSRYRSASLCENCAVILWNDLTERLP
jgi:RNase P subunit RPR2